MVDTQFLGIPDVTGLIFAGLAFAAFCTAFIGVVTGAAGGLVLLSIMAMIFPPAILIPLHTVIQLGTGTSRAIMLRRYVLYQTIVPFVIGSVIGAAVGAQIFVALPTAVLQGGMGVFIIVLAWLPKIARKGGQTRRFGLIGFAVTFLGMFVSATGTLLAPFVASASPDRRNHVATMGILMAFGHITKIVAFGLLGITLGSYIPLMAAMITTAVAGNWVGSRALNLVPERAFRIVLQVLLTVLATRLIWVGVRDGGLF